MRRYREQSLVVDPPTGDDFVRVVRRWVIFLTGTTYLGDEEEFLSAVQLRTGGVGGRVADELAVRGKLQGDPMTWR